MIVGAELPVYKQIVVHKSAVFSFSRYEEDSFLLR